MKKDDKDDPFADSFWHRKLPNGVASWAAWAKPSRPEPVYALKDQWQPAKQRTDLVFAKSCASGNWCRTSAGTATEPASNFGKIMVVASMLLPSASDAIAMAIGAEAGLARIAGGGIMQQRMTWAIRGAGGTVSVFILGMLPAKMGDGTLHTDDQLRRMSQATTRVRFQFRHDAEGVVQIYGIHTGTSGDDSVRIVRVKWNATKTAMEAELNGITILWTPPDSSSRMPPLTYPDESAKQLGTILVHPIPENMDSQLDGLPGDDITTDDCILVFPTETGLKSLYVVYAKPPGEDHSYHPAPKELTAFPDAKITPRKTSIQGGGGLRKRWKTRDGTIYEWDSQHGAVEKYNKRGAHLGEYNHETGEKTKNADKTRGVEP